MRQKALQIPSMDLQVGGNDVFSMLVTGHQHTVDQCRKVVKSPAEVSSTQIMLFFTLLKRLCRVQYPPFPLDSRR